MTNFLKIIYFTPFLLFLFYGCAKKDTFNNSDTKVGHSTVVFFPTIETNGERLVILNVGDSYTDEGATAILNQASADYTTTGSFDTNVPGVYVIQYETKNEQGFGVTDFRTVVVIGDDVTGNDFSGTYARYVDGAPNGQTSTWTKVANGVYTLENPGGAAGLTVTAVNYTGKTIVVPLQLTNVGPFESTETEYDDASVPPQYIWAIVNGTYGPQDRTFIKQ